MEYKHYKHKTLQHGGIVPAAGAGRLHRPQRPQDPQHPRGVQPRAADIRDIRHQGLNGLSRVVQGVQQNCSHLVICSFIGFYSSKLKKVGTILKISGNLLHDTHKNFEK